MGDRKPMGGYFVSSSRPAPFADDFIFPSQLPDRHNAPMPERKLLLAVLEDQARLAQKPLEAGMRSDMQVLIEDAREWILGDEQGDPSGKFTFVQLCNHLGLEPGYVRRRIVEGCSAGWPRARTVLGAARRLNHDPPGLARPKRASLFYSRGGQYVDRR